MQRIITYILIAIPLLVSLGGCMKIFKIWTK